MLIIQSNTNVNDVYSGGGGGGGSGRMKNKFVSLIQQEYTITIGAGGVGGDVGSDGKDGGSTSIKK